MIDCSWIEGDRAFCIAFGSVTAASCLVLAVPLLWWILPGRRTWFFTPQSDPQQHLQLGYGIFCMAMAFTDALCRFIPHAHLAWVHPAFFFTTVGLVIALGPRLLFVALRTPRNVTRRSARAFGEAAV
jgi:hypothetical protein